MKPLKIIRITFFICGIAAACVSLGYYLKIHRSGFYDIFTEGEYAKVMDWSLAIAVVCVVAFILSFVCERLEIRLDKARLVKAQLMRNTLNTHPSERHYMRISGVQMMSCFIVFVMMLKNW